jgi:hypothetical protein
MMPRPGVSWTRHELQPDEISASELFRRSNLFSRRSFDLGLFALLIGVVQEPVNEVGASLLRDPRLLRFLLFSEKLVVYFPAH